MTVSISRALRSQRGFGWRRDLPDARDFTPETPNVAQLLRPLESAESTEDRLPSEVDLREFLPQADDQLHLDSSTTHACIGLVEYFERRCHGNLERRSRLFHHQLTCRLLRKGANTDTDLRTGLKALVRFGLPPETLWPYETSHFDHEPSPYLYSYNESYRDLAYVRLDGEAFTGAETLRRAKSFLAANIPVAFGVSIPTSCEADGSFHYRTDRDGPLVGQAVVGVGYDDEHLGATKGAVLVRNSWGTSWSDNGYGWLPYAVVLDKLAVDFWTLLRADWLASGEVQCPSVVRCEVSSH